MNYGATTSICLQSTNNQVGFPTALVPNVTLPCSGGTTGMANKGTLTITSGNTSIAGTLTVTGNDTDNGNVSAMGLTLMFRNIRIEHHSSDNLLFRSWIWFLGYLLTHTNTTSVSMGYAVSTSLCSLTVPAGVWFSNGHASLH